MIFNERKVAQMAAFFLRECGGSMSVLKLTKLLYLAERESLRLYGTPMCGDCLVAMPHGPVLSVTYDLMSGTLESIQGGWQDWISDREDYDISLKKSVYDNTAFDELSGADIDILKSVWGEFGHMGRWQIRNYTHDNCPEWKDPQGSSHPITYEKIFLALNHSEAEARELAEQIEDERTIDKLFQAG